jgi:hypothetical protein
MATVAALIITATGKETGTQEERKEQADGALRLRVHGVSLEVADDGFSAENMARTLFNSWRQPRFTTSTRREASGFTHGLSRRLRGFRQDRRRRGTVYA